MLEEAFAALKTYNWGDDYNTVKPIYEAEAATYGDQAARTELENQLIASLGDGLTRDGIDFVCRRLRTVGTDSSVETLAAMLPEPENSHMARYALERIPTDKAGNALRESLGSLNGDLQIGVISSLGVRAEGASVEPLAALLSDGNDAVASAAAYALGDIRTAEAADALSAAEPSDAVTPAVTDALLSCAESLLAAGNKGKALVIYRSLVSSPRDYVRLAASRGVLACAGG